MYRLCIVLLLAKSFAASAQTETQIRDHYNAVNKQIATALELGYEGIIYNNQWVTNKNGTSWPAVGNYSDTVNFWYDDPPDHISASERNPKTVLLKVIDDRVASHFRNHEEYLFKDGKLWFYFSAQAEEGNDWETRVYFNNKGVAIKSIVKANGKELSAKDLLLPDNKDMKPNAIKILADSKNYQDLFVKSML